MPNDVEELLRDGMRRATDDVRMAPGLAGRLIGRAAGRRRRRLITRAGVAGGTVLGAAGLAAVAGIAIGGPLTTPSARPAAARVQTVSYVMGQANRALTAMAGGPALAQLTWTVTGRAPAGLNATGWLYNESPQSQVMVRYGDGHRSAIQVVRRWHEQHLDLTITAVNYQHKTWTRLPARPGFGPARAPSCQLPGLVTVYMSPAALHQLMACGDYSIVGRPRVDGVPTIELAVDKIGKMTFPRSIETIWVNSSTYLPVRILLGPPKIAKIQVDLRWLPVTPASLAHVKLSIPAGFKHTGPGLLAP
jgi:hypothetical protein